MNRQQIEQALDEVATYDGLLAFEYAVAPDNELHCRDDYSAEEWEALIETDVVRFAEASVIERMRAFMLINAGLPPWTADDDELRNREESQQVSIAMKEADRVCINGLGAIEQAVRQCIPGSVVRASVAERDSFGPVAVLVQVTLSGGKQREWII